MDFKDIAVRAVKTAVQAFVAAVPVSMLIDHDMAALQAAAIAAGAAGLSIIWNAILAWSQSE